MFLHVNQNMASLWNYEAVPDTRVFNVMQICTIGNYTNKLIINCIIISLQFFLASYGLKHFKESRRYKFFREYVILKSWKAWICDWKKREKCSLSWSKISHNIQDHRVCRGQTTENVSFKKTDDLQRIQRNTYTHSLASRPDPYYLFRQAVELLT